jgi:uncharacterized protein YaaN involved in tellurite resistance
MVKKKTEEKPIVTVSTTTDVAEKPRKTRKNASSNLRSTDAVISEITERKSTVADTSAVVSTILKGKNTKKTTSLRRINDNGDVNMTDITAEELAEYQAIGKKLDVHDKMSISNYGAELSAQLNRSTKDLLARGTQTKLGDETQSIMKQISSKLVTIDLDEIKRPNWFVRTVREIPLLNKLFFSVKAFRAKYEGIEKDVELMQEKLHAAQAVALRDNTELEKRFQDTIAYIDVLEKLIVAAKIKEEEYGQALEIMEANPDKYSAIDIHDTRNFKH